MIVNMQDSNYKVTVNKLWLTRFVKYLLHLLPLLHFIFVIEPQSRSHAHSCCLNGIVLVSCKMRRTFDGENVDVIVCCAASTQEMTMMFPDRVIAVRGSVENMSKAEAAISALLRECLDKDVHSMVPAVLAFLVTEYSQRCFGHLLFLFRAVVLKSFLVPASF